MNPNIERSFSFGLSLKKYSDKILSRYDMGSSRSVDSLLAQGDKFSLKQCPEMILKGQ